MNSKIATIKSIAASLKARAASAEAKATEAVQIQDQLTATNTALVNERIGLNSTIEGLQADVSMRDQTIVGLRAQLEAATVGDITGEDIAALDASVADLTESDESIRDAIQTLSDGNDRNDPS